MEIRIVFNDFLIGVLLIQFQNNTWNDKKLLNPVII